MFQRDALSLSYVRIASGFKQVPRESALGSLWTSLFFV
jgi:hypothetical protein